MALLESPDFYVEKCIVISGKYIVLKEDYSFLDSNDVELIHKECGYKECFFEDNTGIFVSDIMDETHIPAGFILVYIREFISQKTDCSLHNVSDSESVHISDLHRVLRAKALREWKHSNTFCPSCGNKLAPSLKETALVCTSCSKIHFPKIEPCIIMRVVKDGKILLAKHTNRNENMYACIAGFVEAGENFEQACYREVLEETGIKIKNIKYLGSQSWPFPFQLMLGFEAEYESGEIKVQEDELLEAKWFDPDNLPTTPPAGSISYDLIHFNI